jgi:uncharacterized protein (TIGR00369 family)
LQPGEAGRILIGDRDSFGVTFRMSSKPVHVNVVPTEAPSGFRQLVGYRLEEWRENSATLTLVVGPRHLNRSGNVHSGVLTTLIDAAGAFAGCWCGVAGHTRKTTTLSLSSQFVAPSTDSRLVAVGQVRGASEKIYQAQIEIRDGGGKLVATGHATYVYLPGSENPDGVPLDRKPDRRGTALG